MLMAMVMVKATGIRWAGQNQKRRRRSMRIAIRDHAPLYKLPWAPKLVSRLETDAHRLAAAILLQAMRDATGDDSKQRADVRRCWDSARTHEIGGLRWCCDILRLDAEALRLAAQEVTGDGPDDECA